MGLTCETNLKGAKSMAMFGLSCRKALVGSRMAIIVLFGIMKLRNKPCHLVGLHFQHLLPVFQLRQTGIFESLD